MVGARSTTFCSLLKAGSAVLLLFVSASVASASQPSRSGHGGKRATRHAHAPAGLSSPVAWPAIMCDPRAPEIPSIQKIVSQTKAVGGPVKRLRRSRLDIHHTTSLARATRASHDDEQAIQNDTLAAHTQADPDIPLGPLGFFVDAFEQRPFTIAFSPRSPRGPPALARHRLWDPGSSVKLEVIDAGSSSRPEV